MLAQARDGQLPAGPSPDALKDAALAYLRVVTFGSDLPDRPHVAEALLRAAQLQEKLNDPTAAGRPLPPPGQRPGLRQHAGRGRRPLGP